MNEQDRKCKNCKFYKNAIWLEYPKERWFKLTEEHPITHYVLGKGICKGPGLEYPGVQKFYVTDMSLCSEWKSKNEP